MNACWNALTCTICYQRRNQKFDVESIEEENLQIKIKYLYYYKLLLCNRRWIRNQTTKETVSLHFFMSAERKRNSFSCLSTKKNEKKKKKESQTLKRMKQNLPMEQIYPGKNDALAAATNMTQINLN